MRAKRDQPFPARTGSAVSGLRGPRAKSLSRASQTGRSSGGRPLLASPFRLASWSAGSRGSRGVRPGVGVLHSTQAQVPRSCCGHTSH